MLLANGECGHLHPVHACVCVSACVCVVHTSWVQARGAPNPSTRMCACVCAYVLCLHTCLCVRMRVHKSSLRKSTRSLAHTHSLSLLTHNHRPSKQGHETPASTQRLPLPPTTTVSTAVARVPAQSKKESTMVAVQPNGRATDAPIFVDPDR